MWEGKIDCRNCVSKQHENALRLAVVNDLSRVCLGASLSLSTLGSTDPVEA